MRVSFHVVHSRREYLLEQIRQDGFLPLAQICQRLGVSIATARRDLAAVAADGRVTRTRGGALADYNTDFASLDERATRARTAKGRIASAAVKLIPVTGTVFLDAGTTICAVARAMLHRRKRFNRLIVVTNSLAVATILGGCRSIELHVLGGTFLHRQAVLLGDSAVRSLGNWRFDAAFLGGQSMDTAGITNSHAEIAAFQRAVLMKTRSRYFCLDASKLGPSTPFRVTGWDQGVKLITDLSGALLTARGLSLPPDQLIAVGK